MLTHSSQMMPTHLAQGDESEGTHIQLDEGFLECFLDQCVVWDQPGPLLKIREWDCIPIGKGSFSNWPYLWERIWPVVAMNSEAFVMNQFLWDYHSWAEGVQIEVLLLVSASLGFVQNESTYGDLPDQTEDCFHLGVDLV